MQPSEKAALNQDHSLNSALNNQFMTQLIRNSSLLRSSIYLKSETTFTPSLFHLSFEKERLSNDDLILLEAIEIDAARIALKTAGSLAEIGEIASLGGSLGIIPPLLITMLLSNGKSIDYTIEHAHTCLGYYALLASLGYVNSDHLINGFRRGIDFPGHVAWLPGATQLSGGRLGVMIPYAVGQAIGKRAEFGCRSRVIVHCGDAGWISGHALNGFNIAARYSAPVTFVMCRNGIQHTDTTDLVMNVDPRKIIEALGVTILEIQSLHDSAALFEAHRTAFNSDGPVLIYPSGFRSVQDERITLTTFAEKYNIYTQLEEIASRLRVALDTEVWIPGSLMSYRDVLCMLESLFYVNNLPGGVNHHDGHLLGRNLQEILTSPLCTFAPEHQKALQYIRSVGHNKITIKARPNPGSPNLIIDNELVSKVELPTTNERVTPRIGASKAYSLLAECYPEAFFLVSCDLDRSTKLTEAKNKLQPSHCVEVGIEELAATLVANGISLSSEKKKFVVVSSYSAYFEGIAREGFDSWRYQRNLTGVNEGLNVLYHLSHVGACTGRDHFAGWGLDWINLGLCYLPYLDRFYAPADARAAFIAVCDAASRYGGHMIGLPRDELPVLKLQGSEEAFWNANSEWEPISCLRLSSEAKCAILAFGGTAFLADEIHANISTKLPFDVYVVNGLPLNHKMLMEIGERYSEGIITIEDGLIGTPDSGLRGFASLVSSALRGKPLDHIGITDPRVGPSNGHKEVWQHFGLSAENIERAIRSFICNV